MADSKKRVFFPTLLASLGAGLEYYDFIIYGMMAGYLSSLFFSSQESWVGLMKTFGVFAIGYFARPFGGILFGLFGDTFGRKKTFLTVMFLMAFSTFCIGLLPTYDQIGIFAPCLLVFFRLLQGLSFGAELPGAITVVCEYVGKEKQGAHSGFVISSVGLGASLASFVLFILSYHVDQDQMLRFYWRLPFLLGGVLAFANIFIRKYLKETPEFSSLQKSRSSAQLKEPLLYLIGPYRREVLLGIGISIFVASLVIFSLYLPTFLKAQYSLADHDVYFAMTCGMIWSSLILPFCGWISDRVGNIKVLLTACLSFLLGGFFLFQILTLNGLNFLILFMMLYQTIISFLMASYFPLLAKLFPTHIRYTGIAACYNITYSMMGCAPLLITALINSHHTPSIGIWFLILCSFISAGATFIISRFSRLVRLSS